jgi:PKD repeat protein
MYNQFPNCFTITDSVFTIYGPKAIMESEPVRITFRDQCTIMDTVRFITPNPYLSCRAGNGSMIHIWNFGDPYAPACTTDTRNGINVGMNCNFSKDTFDVWHFYSPGKDDCYKSSLYMKDPVLGCEDTDTSSIALTAPSAHWDSAVTPVRRGLYYLGKPCLGNILTFMFDETLPTCGYERLWLNLDSACDKSKWKLVDDADINLMFLHGYDSTCDKVDGYITVGMIVENGNCRDTVWYHNFLQMRPITPFIKLKVEPGCGPFKVTATLVDSIQYDLDNIRWDFNIVWYNNLNTLRSGLPVDSPGVDSIIWQYMVPPDSVIHGQLFTHPRSGIYSVSIGVKNQLQCSRTDNLSIGAGYFADFEIMRNALCVRDTITLHDYIRYYNYNAFQGIDGVNFWADTARAAAGKEQVWWDIGDGNGFSYTGSHPLIHYEKPGMYAITMVVKDSTGCFDTIVKPAMLHVTDLNTHIQTLEDSYFCAPQIVIVKDSSLVIDTVGATIPSWYDYITDWSWSFGDNTALSLLQNSSHTYTKNGIFNMVLTVTTRLGLRRT